MFAGQFKSAVNGLFGEGPHVEYAIALFLGAVTVNIFSRPTAQRTISFWHYSLLLADGSSFNREPIA